MIKNMLRVGNFTSSEIVALTTQGKAKGTFGKPALTYIEEKLFERNLGRSLSAECDARALTWGKLLEGRCFDLLPTAYSLNSQETILHPDYDYWAGSPDGFRHIAEKTVCDIKAPLTLKSFCRLVKPLYESMNGMDAMNCLRAEHKDGETYYWQLVSNACITGCDWAELIIYMPYESELPEIKQLAQDGQGKHYWIAMAEDDTLPFIKVGGYYKNINIIRFEIPEEDKDLLTARVIEAGKLLTSAKELAGNLLTPSPEMA